MIALIDYGVGNIFAFQNVYKRLNIPCKIVKSVNDLVDVKKLILPGVGSFDYAMTQLNASGMRERLDELVLGCKTPVIGICVGMQMMANGSDEGAMDGLRWVDAQVKKFDASTIKTQTKLPHMGWNDVESIKGHPLFVGLEEKAIFYFLHSYYFNCNIEGDSIGTSEYGVKFTSSINHNNIFGVQFHPEKSHHYGEILLRNFANI